MTAPPYPLTDLTVVLGPPLGHDESFLDFQARAHRGESVIEHPWAHHEYAALDALTQREGPISRPTLIETFVGSVLQVSVIIADLERQWVRHADGQLYVALTIGSEDVRPRAAGLALHDPTVVDALNAVAQTISTLDDRAWMTWSSRTWHDTGDEAHARRTGAVVAELAASVLAGRATPGEEPLPLVDDLLAAIRLGRRLADTPHDPIVRELRALRHVDPLRVEWARIAMDAFYLGALDVAELPARSRGEEGQGLAYLYLGKERSDRLKADPLISHRFRGEIAAKTCMTAYALERLAPSVSQALFDVVATH